VYSLFVYFATTYIAAFVGGLAVLIIGAALGLVGVAALFAVVSALLAWTAFSCLLSYRCAWSLAGLQQRKITYKLPVRRLQQPRSPDSRLQLAVPSTPI